MVSVLYECQGLSVNFQDSATTRVATARLQQSQKCFQSLSLKVGGGN